MRTTLTIRDDLYRQAKAAAAQSGESVGRVVEHALYAYLHRPEGELPPAPLPAFDFLIAKPGVDFTRTSELLHDLDSGTA